MLEKYVDEIYRCTRCGFCRVWGWSGIETVCPIYRHTPGWETHYARGRVKLAKSIAEGQAGLSQAMVDHTLLCTLCGNCEVACPIKLPLHDIFQAMRSDLMDKGFKKEDHLRIAANIAQLGHPFGERKRRKYENKPLGQKVKVLYYPGCNANYNAPKIIRATTEVFKKLHLDFYVVEEDTCCGYPLYDTGQIAEMRAAAVKNMEVLQKYNPDLIVTACPGCLNAMQKVYPELLGLAQPFALQDISQFLLPLVQGKLTAAEKAVTWHDPCVLGRRLGIYEEPRHILQAIPGVQFTELRKHRRKSQCCGAPLAVLGELNQVSAKVAMDRIHEAKEVGAEELVTSCPACYNNLKRAADFVQNEVQVKFLTEKINEVLKDA